MVVQKVEADCTTFFIAIMIICNNTDSPRGFFHEGSFFIFFAKGGSKPTPKSPYSEKQNFFQKTPPQNTLQISVAMEGKIF